MGKVPVFEYVSSCLDVDIYAFGISEAEFCQSRLERLTFLRRRVTQAALRYGNRPPPLFAVRSDGRRDHVADVRLGLGAKRGGGARCAAGNFRSLPNPCKIKEPLEGKSREEPTVDSIRVAWVSPLLVNVQYTFWPPCIMNGRN